MSELLIGFFATLYVVIGIIGGFAAVGFLLCLALVIWSDLARKFRAIYQDESFIAEYRKHIDKDFMR